MDAAVNEKAYVVRRAAPPDNTPPAAAWTDQHCSGVGGGRQRSVTGYGGCGSGLQRSDDWTLLKTARRLPRPWLPLCPSTLIPRAGIAPLGPVTGRCRTRPWPFWKRHLCGEHYRLNVKLVRFPARLCRPSRTAAGPGMGDGTCSQTPAGCRQSSHDGDVPANPACAAKGDSPGALTDRIGVPISCSSIPCAQAAFPCPSTRTEPPAWKTAAPLCGAFPHNHWAP